MVKRTDRPAIKIAVDMGRKATKTNKQTACQSNHLGVSMQCYNKSERVKIQGEKCERGEKCDRGEMRKKRNVKEERKQREKWES